jgi:hypothetical protein
MSNTRLPPSQSPERHTFQLDAYRQRRESDGEEISDEYVAMLEQIRLQDKLKWQDPERCINNMEYDLVTTDWILAKARASEAYAQNLYAAMCNNDFQRNDVWPRLSDQKWHCSWRYAGGIIADMRQEGDYIDWYCSGINNGDWQKTPEEVAAMTPAQAEHYHELERYVNESVVTDEIREDLFRLGWLVIEEDSD